ncbi:MAG: hypothetical protein ACRC1U_06250, partial [Vibrionaceae bacterium]
MQPQHANAASEPAAQEALIDLFIKNINGLTLAAENKPTLADLYSVRLLRRAAAFNYPLAMRLSFSQTAIDACKNPVQQFLMQQINQQSQPYIRLRLLVMVFTCFYHGNHITQGRCSQLFNLSQGVISTWRAESFVHIFSSTEDIVRFIERTDAELQGRAGHPLATRAPEPNLNAPQQSNYAFSAELGTIARNSLASILGSLHERFGLQWNNTHPHTASASIESGSISSHALMQQLTFDLVNTKLPRMQNDESELTQALLQAFNSSKTPSARLRLFLIIMRYTRRHLYHTVTSDLCRMFSICPNTAASWTHVFKQRVVNPERGISPNSLDAINAAINHISGLPAIAAIQIHLVPPPDTSTQTLEPEAAAAETARAHTAAQQPQTPPQPRPTVQIPQELLQLNLPAAQAAAPAAHRHGAAQHAIRHHPYAPRQPQMQVHPHPQLQTDRLLFPPQRQIPLEQRPTAQQVATITFAPQPQPQQQQQEQQQLELEQQQLRQLQQRQLQH